MVLLLTPGPAPGPTQADSGV
ncbi:Hypothetical protein SLIV_23098 [Streptomyces lividans TK24]|uniref:Uncharacterized protein n=1 Tax=Streptomyces lividans TK24 TaxID=457428 RepID=A0ABX6TPT8_STRLI|nr:Hypothetical protein SLIV_23098 [Streptomyces lividans TK24]QSJ11118.1 Hypothetical protein SLIVDG2_23098 [Streptomyces lividans]QTD72028.1 Hypothetical protein SLIVYQS_23098 [Streptomyces lividans TK24] [Streptomyces lividans]